MREEARRRDAEAAALSVSLGATVYLVCACAATSATSRYVDICGLETGAACRQIGVASIAHTKVVD